MAKIDSIVLTPGANALINTEPKEEKPPEGFIDNTVRVYKMNQDGSNGEHLRDIPPYPEGWDTKFNPSIKRAIPDEMEGDETMPKTQVENWPEIIKRGMELIEKGTKPYTAAAQLVKEYSLPIKPQSVYPKLKKAMENKASGKPVGEVKAEKPSREELLDLTTAESETEQQNAGDTEANQPARTNYTFAQYQEQIKKGIELTSSEHYDLVSIKLQLMSVVLAEYHEGSCPASITLQIINKISDMEVAI